MSGRPIKVGEMAEAIREQLEDYKDLAADEMKKAIRKAGRTVKEDINSSAPVLTGRYAQSWAARVTAEDSASLEVTVYSPSRYRIAHLLENGHAKRNGGRVRAIPHIRPAEEHGLEQLEAELAKALEG